MSRSSVSIQPNFWSRLDGLSQSDRSAIGQKILLGHLWLTIVGLAVRVWMGWATQSLSLLADSLHTLIDAVSATLSLMALSSPDRFNGRESWSHGPLETALILALTAVLGFGGLSLGSIAIHQLTLTPSLAMMPAITSAMIQVMALVIIAQSVAAFLQYRIGGHLSSIALKIHALQFLQDVWLNIGLLISLVLISLGYRWLDSMLTIALVLTSGISLWRVILRQLPTLIQPVAIAPEALKQLARQVQSVTQCVTVQSRGVVGRQVWVEMTLVLHPEFMGSQNWVTQQIEALIRDRYGPVQVRIEVAGDRLEKDEDRE
ncbi:MAG: cation transporter [Alkalinema sp. FL-bin-369]|nr:cation transporter [Leptolyngbyaceae cyanobacterium LF-bin-369]